MGAWLARGRRTSCLGVVVLLVTSFACGAREQIEKPTPLFTQSPVKYPAQMWSQDVEGVTVVRLLVNVEGGVDSVVVAEGSGHPALDSAAVQGVRGASFEPARKKGKPVQVWVRLPVNFFKDGSSSTGGGPPSPPTTNPSSGADGS